MGDAPTDATDLDGQGPETAKPAVAGPVFLLGMMGAGKSTVGVALAQALAVPFIDLDRRIERMAGQAIPTLFESGEPHFRAWERRALTSLIAEPGFALQGSVVSTGGGVVEDPGNLDAMRAAGVTVFLDPPLEILLERLSSPAQRGQRPMLDGEAPTQLRTRLQRLLSDRRAEYERADFRDAADGAPQEVVARISSLLR